MNGHGLNYRRLWAAAACLLALAWLAAASTIQAATIVNDSWADGGRDDGADPLDSNWWTSASSAGIEVTTGSLGMVTGGSGRGIHTIFPTQTLSNVGDKLIATYSFTTPATVGTNLTAAFRAGLFDTLGRAGLNADVPASSGSPNALYGWGIAAGGPGTAGLPGYMLDMDVNTAAADLSFREHDAGTVNPTGRLMGTTSGFTQLSPTGTDGAISFAANTSYTGSITVERISATELALTGALGAETLTITDVFDSPSFGMLAFWANSNVFGSSSTADTPNNGIDFTNVRIEFIPIPEPGSFGLALLSAVGVLATRRGSRRP